jgi:hypothetical protein
MSLAARSWQDQGRRQPASAGDATPVRGTWRRPGRRLLWWSAFALTALIALAASILTLLAAGYQPLQRGNGGAASFPGLRTGAGIRWVSQYIPNGPYLYVPAQRGTFALAASVVNRGSFPVTIVGESQAPGSPFTAAGPARYLTDAAMLANLSPPPRYLLRDITLAPGQGIMIGMPLRITYCANRRGYVGEDVFLVTERYLWFTHTVPVPFVDYGRPVITNAPGGQSGAPGTFCSG